jgi:hypothetical protein
MASIFELEQPVFGRSNDSLTVVAASDADTELTAAQSVNSLVIMTPGGARDIDTASAAAIVAELGDGVRVGTSFSLIVRNEAAATHAITLVAGSGVTLATDNTNTIAHTQTRMFIGRVTNKTSGSEAVTLYSMGTGVH